MIYEVLPKYPHMLPDEAAIWDRFLHSKHETFLSLSYDVHVGEGVIPPPGLPDWINNVIAATSQKRIDVVAETKDSIWIIELKPRGGMSAVGQLLAYEVLYNIKFKPIKPLKKVMMCERMAPDLDIVYSSYGIEIIII
jgi:hypothetical protein